KIQPIIKNRRRIRRTGILPWQKPQIRSIKNIQSSQQKLSAKAAFVIYEKYGRLRLLFDSAHRAIRFHLMLHSVSHKDVRYYPWCINIRIYPTLDLTIFDL